MWKSQRAGLKQRKSNLLIMLFNLSKLRRTQKRQMQSETNLHWDESRKYKSFKSWWTIIESLYLITQRLWNFLHN